MAQAKATVADRVVERVADSTGTDVLELPPLYEAVDPDALDALVETMGNGAVSFEYAGRDVRILSDGSVDVTEGDGGLDGVDR